MYNNPQPRSQGGSRGSFESPKRHTQKPRHQLRMHRARATSCAGQRRVPGRKRGSILFPTAKITEVKS